MIYQEFPPASALRDIVASYWRFALEASHGPAVVNHTVPPDGLVSICWLPVGRAVIVGPRVAALHVQVKQGLAYTGVRFLPGVAGQLLGVDVKALRDQVVLFDRPGLASAARTFSPAAFDTLILEWREMAPWQGPDPVVQELARRILESDGAIPVAALVAGLGLGYRQILRRFFEATGLTPKEFARLRRIRAACVQALSRSDSGWANVAAATGFADQSHMAREFRDVFGWPPRLVLEYLSRIQHRDVTG